MQRRLWGIWVLSLLLPCVEGAAENRRVYKVDTLAMNSIVQKYSAALAALSHDTTAFPLDTGMRYAPPFFFFFSPYHEKHRIRRQRKFFKSCHIDTRAVYFYAFSGKYGFFSYKLVFIIVVLKYNFIGVFQ